MRLDVTAPVAAVEWPTLALAIALNAAFLLLTWFHAAMAWWVFVALGAWLAAWYGSLQHEMIHGHPTRDARVNEALVAVPIWLWLPFERYRDTHLAHHRDERLTDPIDDPESRYWTPEAWTGLNPAFRGLARMEATLLGRLTLGPASSIGRFLAREIGAIARGDAAIARIWRRHALSLAPLAVWLFVICEIPLWLYALGVVQGGTALTLLRSFAEHRAAPAVAERTAIVEDSTVLGPLFLFNNLHVAHHRWPHVPWYRLPALHAAHRDALVQANGGLVYAGYGDVLRRFILRPHDDLVHPQGRAPYGADPVTDHIRS